MSAFLPARRRDYTPAGFCRAGDGYPARTMIDTKSIPRPGERWLSCPPYLLIAHVLRVDERADPPVVSYELQDDEGLLLESVELALLDEGWWRTFQPMVRRSG